MWAERYETKWGAVVATSGGEGVRSGADKRAAAKEFTRGVAAATGGGERVHSMSGGGDGGVTAV